MKSLEEMSTAPGELLMGPGDPGLIMVDMTFSGIEKQIHVCMQGVYEFEEKKVRQSRLFCTLVCCACGFAGLSYSIEKFPGCRAGCRRQTTARMLRLCSSWRRPSRLCTRYGPRFQLSTTPNDMTAL